MNNKFTYLIIKEASSICTVTINNPGHLNAMSTAVLMELDSLFTALAKKSSIRAVIITGEDKAFVAGADIEEMSNFSSLEAKTFGELGSRVFRKIEQLHIPVIAAINGFALGGGCELAMSCDIRIASEKAKLGQPEVGLGITPGFSGTQRLSRLVGLGKAKELIYTGTIINAQEAERIGLVNKVVPADTLMTEATEMAEVIASKAPLAVSYSKEAINRGYETDIDTGISIEKNLFALCFDTEDQTTGMSDFMNKKQPTFQGK